MRFGIFYSNSYYLRYYETTLTELLERGHHLVVARPDSSRETDAPPFLAGHPEVTVASYPRIRTDGLHQTIKIMRFARDFLRYERPVLHGADANRRRSYAKLVAAAADVKRRQVGEPEPPLRSLTERQVDAAERAFALAESLFPPADQLCRFIEDHRLDAAVPITRMKDKQNDIVKAAQRAGVPAGVIVYSWDNLSSKGLIHVHPERLFVWNDVQVREAETLHGVEPARLEVTGAPRFDAFFAAAPSASRDALLRELGLDPSRRTVLYVGSSTFVAPREPEFVDAWLRAVRGAFDVNVIVRPHPGAVKKGSAWAEWRPGGAGVALAAEARRDKSQDLYDQLFASDAVVGLNTSAEIEAAILDKPVLTVKAGELAPGQEGSMHFHYLLAGEGGGVATAASLEEHVAQLRDALERDPLAAERRRFLESFVRPHGIDRPAGPVLADALERLARLREPANAGLEAS